MEKGHLPEIGVRMSTILCNQDLDYTILLGSAVSMVYI